MRLTFLTLGVAGSHLTWILNPIVVPGDAVPVLDLTCGPYPLGGARGRGVLEGQLHPGTHSVSSGYRAVASSSVQLFNLALGLGAGLAFAAASRFFAPWQRRALGCPHLGGAPWGCCTGAWPAAITRCSRAAETSGLDVGTVSFSWNSCLVMKPSTLSASGRASGGSRFLLRGAACGPCSGWRGVSRLGGGGPLAPPAPSRGRSAALPRLHLGCGGRVRRVASGLLRVVGAGLRVPLSV